MEVDITMTFGSRVPRPRSLALTVVALLVLSVGFVTGAYAQGSSEQRTAVDKVTYLTSFGTFGRDAYAYVAQENGFFEAANLDVTIKPGAGSVDNMKLVAAGQADFAPADVTALVLSRANEGLPVKFVALVHQRTLSAILALRESGIATPKDLEGKTIADVPGSTIQRVFPLWAKKVGVDASKVSFVPAAPPALPSLLASKRVDAVGQFTVGKPLFQAAAGGKPIVAFPYEKAFPGFMGIGLVAADSTIAQKRNLVRRFTAALMKGLKWSIDNPGRTGAILNKAVPLQNPKIAADELKIMKRFAQTPATRKNGMGYVDPKRVASTISIVNNGFKPSRRVTVGDVYAAGFVPAPPKPKR
jgi:NitT/TauT family transport system substrate-binding protein